MPGRKIAVWLAALALICAGPAAGQFGDFGGLIRFQRVFSGITLAQTSAVLPNIGQGLHFIMIHFPAEVAAVSPVQVRLEGSYNGTTFFPISRDVVSVPAGANSVVYAMERANGTWPFVRVNSVVDTPAGKLMTVFYTGAPFPIGNLFFSGDRWIIGGSTAGYDKVTFVLCNGAACAVGTDLTNHYIAVQDLSFRTCHIFAKTAPTGASLIIDLEIIGTGSIFGGTKLVFPAGATTVQTQSTFAVASIRQLQRLRSDIDQIGSITPGQDVTVTCVLDF